MHKLELPAPPPLLFRKLSNPDLSPAAGKTKLQRQLSQDDGRARRSSMAGVLTGKQLLPLSSSMHGGVSQLAWQQHAGEPNNLVRMRTDAIIDNIGIAFVLFDPVLLTDSEIDRQKQVSKHTADPVVFFFQLRHPHSLFIIAFGA
ncbi:hypothetical protein PO909_005624 [Leuciscus waleckii]